MVREGWFWVGLGGELFEGVSGRGRSKGFRPNAAKQKGQVVEKSAVQMNVWVN